MLGARLRSNLSDECLVSGKPAASRRRKAPAAAARDAAPPHAAAAAAASCPFPQAAPRPSPPTRASSFVVGAPRASPAPKGPSPPGTAPSAPRDNKASPPTLALAPRAPRIGSLSRQALVDLVVPLLDAMGKEDPADRPSRTIFHGTCVPCISLTGYLKRILEYGRVSHATIVAALIYLDRILASAAAGRLHVVVSDWTVHRLLLGAVVLSAKYLDDEHYNNHHMAAVGGVTNVELNAIELKMAAFMGFSLYIAPEHFTTYEEMLMPTATAAGAADAKAAAMELEEQEGVVSF